MEGHGESKPYDHTTSGSGSKMAMLMVMENRMSNIIIAFMF